jgi:hypothetical protein
MERQVTGIESALSTSELVRHRVLTTPGLLAPRESSFQRKATPVVESDHVVPLLAVLKQKPDYFPVANDTTTLGTRIFGRNLASYTPRNCCIKLHLLAEIGQDQVIAPQFFTPQFLTPLAPLVPLTLSPSLP